MFEHGVAEKYKCYESEVLPCQKNIIWQEETKCALINGADQNNLTTKHRAAMHVIGWMTMTEDVAKISYSMLQKLVVATLEFISREFISCKEQSRHSFNSFYSAELISQSQ